MRQRPYRNWPVVGRHAPKFRARYQHGACAQIRAAESREHAGRSGANDDDVSHLGYSSPSLLRHLEADIVGDDRARSHRQLLGGYHAQSDEGDFVFPDRSQELLDELDGEKLPGAAAIAESERRVAGGIDYRACLTLNYGIHSAKRTVGQLRLAPVSDGEGFFVEGTLRQPRLPAFGLVIIHSRRRRFVAIRIELFRIAPVSGIHARFQVWGNDDAVRRAQKLPLSFHTGNAPSVGRDGSEQLHHKPIQGSERTAVRFVRFILHHPLEPRSNDWIALHWPQPRHDVVDRVAPLAQCNEVVEALKDDVLLAEILSQLSVLKPVVDKCPVCIGHLAVDDRLHADVKPILERLAQFAHAHIVVMDDLQCGERKSENGVKAGPELPDLLRDGIPRDSEM